MSMRMKKDEEKNDTNHNDDDVCVAGEVNKEKKE